MNNDDINDKLRELNTEDFIWIIYIGIIILSWYSNSLERKFFLFNDYLSKEKYRKIMVLIFSILIVVYCYFLKDSIDGLKKIKPTDSDKKKSLAFYSFIASLLITISGFIFLYIALNDTNIDVEIAFN